MRAAKAATSWGVGVAQKEVIDPLVATSSCTSRSKTPRVEAQSIGWRWRGRVELFEVDLANERAQWKNREELLTRADDLGCNIADCVAERAP